MKKFYLPILLIALTVTIVSAQQPFVKVKGHVINKQTGAPVAGQTMFVMLDSVNSEYYNKAITDEAGYYFFNLPFMGGTTQASFTVYTNDCNGSILSGTGKYINGNDGITIDFSICGNSQPGCEALFKYSPSPDNMLKVAFYDGSRYLPGSNKIVYSWSFGDSTYSNEQNPVHTFNLKGTYYVCLSISSSDSLCSNNYCSSVTVGSPNSGPCENYFIYYADSTKNNFIFEGSVLNGQADTWMWDFGDGTTATGQKVTHSFSLPANDITVCLTTTGANADGTVCTSKSCQQLSIYVPSPCESYFWYQHDSVSGTDYVFEGYAKNAQISSWTWDFGDGTTATGQKVSHSFANTNTSHTVCLTTTGVDASGATCTHSYCQDVFVYIPSACESSFSYYPDSTGIGYTFEGYAKNSQINTWMWDFGDGTTASGQKVTHSFIKSSNVPAGHYVCLTTTGIGASGDSCTFNSCQSIYINPPSLCNNYFKIYSEDGSKYTFSGTVASGAKASYYWNFGDGTSDSGQVVTHSFGKILAVFNVCLTTVVGMPAATGIYECKSISCQVIYNGVDSSACKALFSAVPESNENTYHFLNQSQSNYSYSYWDFGDGSQSTEANPAHTYSSPGLYVACLTIADNNNCKSQSCQEIWVNMIQDGCKASFYYFSPDSVQNSVNYMFVNTSTESVYSNLKWSFGDGTESTDFNPVHTYATPGIYKVCLKIWDSLGSCQNTYCKDIFAGKIAGDNSVSGVVMAGNTFADKGIVWLISPNNTFYAETQINSAGTYKFNGVPNGSYYIYAMLTPGSSEFFAYMPTYYGNSLSWQGATIINTSEPNAWYPINLISSMELNTGDATITGTIYWIGNIKAEGIPAANVEVVLYNNSGNPIAYTFTNNEGSFEFNNLPYGDYTVQAEMQGKANQIIPVNLSESSSALNIDFRVNESSVYMLGLETPDKSSIKAGNPYPNPVKDMLTMELNAPVSGTATVEVIDIQGRVIYRELTELSLGQNRIRIQTGEFKKGVYQLRIKTDGQKPVQRRFVR